MSNKKGFTLIELMIVVAILGVLTMVAITSYKGYVRAARAEEGKQLLLEIKMKQEQYFATYSQYVTSSTGENSSDWYPPSSAKVSNGHEFDWSGLNCATAGTDVKKQAMCALGLKPGGSGSAGKIERLGAFRVATYGWSASNPTPSSSYAFVNNMDLTQRWFYATVHADLDTDGTYSTFLITNQSDAIVTFNETE